MDQDKLDPEQLLNTVVEISSRADTLQEKLNEVLEYRAYVFVPLAEAAVKIWNNGLAFDACPTRSDLDAFGEAVSKYVRSTWSKDEKEKTDSQG